MTTIAEHERRLVDEAVAEMEQVDDRAAVDVDKEARDAQVRAWLAHQWSKSSDQLAIEYREWLEDKACFEYETRGPLPIPAPAGEYDPDEDSALDRRLHGWRESEDREAAIDGSGFRWPRSA